MSSAEAMLVPRNVIRDKKRHRDILKISVDRSSGILKVAQIV
jgi:hypothetical protein